MTPGALSLRALRWQPFLETIDFEGFNFTGATFELQVRLYRDAPGSPLISLANATAPAQGLSVTVVTVDAIPTSTVAIRIDEATIEALLPFPGSGAAPGADVVLAYDLVITGGGLPKTRWLQGSFTIEPGVTQ